MKLYKIFEFIYIHLNNLTYSRMRSEGFPFIVWGSSGWTLVRIVLLGASRARRRCVAGGSTILCRLDLRGSVSRRCARADVSRGRRGESRQRVCGCGARDGVSRGMRGEWWMMCVSRGWRTCVLRGRRGTPDARWRLGGR